MKIETIARSKEGGNFQLSRRLLNFVEGCWILHTANSGRLFIKYPRQIFIPRHSWKCLQILLHFEEDISSITIIMKTRLFRLFPFPSLLFCSRENSNSTFPSAETLKTVISTRLAVIFDLISADYRRLRAPVDKHERGIPVAPTSAPVFMLI